VISLVLFLSLSVPSQDAKPPENLERVAIVKRLYAEGRWDEMIRLTPPAADDPADFDFYRGLAFARLQRWAEAKAAFKAGHEKEPQDKRFLLELAGISYQRKDFSEARSYLKQALRLDPGNVYAQDFLATLYFLQGNLEAAIRHWNRIGKPRITDVKLDPEPRVRAIILDRAFAFSPLSVLQLDDLRMSEARIENLEIFSRQRFELEPEGEESFKLLFRSTERNGWGDGKLDGLISLLRGLPYQTIYPELYNLNHSAINIMAMLRWDARKRRFHASFSAPLGQNPGWRLQLYLDGRDENWDLSGTFQASSSPISDLKLKKLEMGAEIRSVASSRLRWRSGISLADREFRNFTGVDRPASLFFTDGLSLKYQAGVDYRLLRNPDRRMTVDAGASGDFGKLFARAPSSFAKFEGSLTFHWFPLSHGDDYEMNGQFHAGRTVGQVPFDELYALGLERDNTLWLRGHIGTRNGKKGSAPMGREYVLWNWEVDKIVHRNAFLTVKLGPFLDVGRITDPSQDFFAKGWLVDPGIQCKFRVLGSVTIVFSYGRSLRSGRNAFYTTVLR